LKKLRKGTAAECNIVNLRGKVPLLSVIL
jgi:hypothetical protein